MTRTFRRRIFYALTALFVLLGSGIVLYAQGWRFDFSTRRFDKIGAIYIRSYPADAAIKLNGESIKNQIGFLTRGTLITDLFPKIYQLELTKPGYQIWHENASVSSMLVTEYKYAVLIPQNATSVASGTINTIFILASNTAKLASDTIETYEVALAKNGDLTIHSSTIANDVRKFSITPDGNLIATLEYKSVEIFSLSDPDKYHRFNLPNIGNIIDLIWYRDREHLFVVYKNSVAFLDLADASLKNFTTITEGTSPRYDPTTNTLYIKLHQQWMKYEFPR